MKLLDLTMKYWKAARDAEGRVALQKPLNTFSRLLEVIGLVYFTAIYVDGLPRTNNDLEHVFGSFRHHQRRCTGQKKSPASLLVRGSCRLISASAYIENLLDFFEGKSETLSFFDKFDLLTSIKTVVAIAIVSPLYRM